MAVSRDKKKQVIEEIGQLLADSKLTVFAEYSGTSVKDMQNLRQQASQNGTTVRVVKNRLFRKALQDQGNKSSDEANLRGQILYAFNAQDEVAPAQDLARFSASVSPLKLVGGLSGDGELLSADDVAVLASLPGKQQLQAKLVGTIAAPLSSMANLLVANLNGVVNVINGRAKALTN